MTHPSARRNLALASACLSTKIRCIGDTAVGYGGHVELRVSHKGTLSLLGTSVRTGSYCCTMSVGTQETTHFVETCFVRIALAREPESRLLVWVNGQGILKMVA